MAPSSPGLRHLVSRRACVHYSGWLPAVCLEPRGHAGEDLDAHHFCKSAVSCMLFPMQVFYFRSCTNTFLLIRVANRARSCLVQPFGTTFRARRRSTFQLLPIASIITFLLPDPQPTHITFSSSCLNLSLHPHSLILSMLHVDPSKRISAHHILQHPWLRMKVPSQPVTHQRQSKSVVARVKNVVEKTFKALNPTPDVDLAPITQSTLAKRRKNPGPALPRCVVAEAAILLSIPAGCHRTMPT